MTSGMLFSNLSWNLITAERPHMCAIAWLSLQQCVQNLKVGACWVCCPGHWIIFSGRAGLAPGVVSGIGLTHKFDRKSSREWFHYRTLWAYIMVHPWVTMIACTHNVPQWIVQDQSISSWHWIYVCNGMFWEIPLIIFCLSCSGEPSRAEEFFEEGMTSTTWTRHQKRQACSRINWWLGYL